MTRLNFVDTFTHRRLPHLDAKGALQFITFRCADSIPATEARLIQGETEHLPPSERTKQRASRIEAFLDPGLGACLLHPGKCGALMRDHLFGQHGVRWELFEWVVMPNHVHFIGRVMPDFTLSQAMQYLKGASSRVIQSAAGTSGQLWMPEYFDRMIRDDRHYNRVAEYIEYNPGKAGLCKTAGDWPLSSARIRGRPRIREERALYGDAYDPFLD